MSAQNTPCMNPSVCGVQSHRPGTIALCMTTSGPSLSSPSSRLFQPVQPLGNAERARTTPKPEREPVIHLQSNDPEPRSWRDRIKNVVEKVGVGILQFDTSVNDVVIGRQASTLSDTPSWDTFKKLAKGAFERPAAAETPQRGTDFLDSALSYDTQDDQTLQNQRRQEREDRMAQAWEQRLQESQEHQPMSPEWNQRFKKMEQSWEERRQQRGF